MLEKRKLVRRHLIYYLQVLERDTDNLIGHLVDITPYGLLLVSEAPIAPGTTLPMRITLPRQILGKRQITFEAISRWSIKDANPNLHATGFGMLDMSVETTLIVGELIRDLGFDERT